MEIPRFSSWLLCLIAVLVTTTNRLAFYIETFSDNEACEYSGHAGHSRLLAGVLTSRSNFERRNTLRNWLRKQRDSINETVNIFFIVADRPCKIQLSQRINEWSCSPIFQGHHHEGKYLLD